jgi:hypothetical protein
MQNIGDIIFTLIPLMLFLYLSLTMLGIFRYNKHTAFLENASGVTKVAVYGGTIAFLVMAIMELT